MIRTHNIEHQTPPWTMAAIKKLQRLASPEPKTTHGRPIGFEPIRVLVHCIWNLGSFIIRDTAVDRVNPTRIHPGNASVVIKLNQKFEWLVRHSVGLGTRAIGTGSRDMRLDGAVDQVAVKVAPGCRLLHLTQSKSLVKHAKPAHVWGKQGLVLQDRQQRGSATSTW